MSDAEEARIIACLIESKDKQVREEPLKLISNNTYEEQVGSGASEAKLVHLMGCLEFLQAYVSETILGVTQC